MIIVTLCSGHRCGRVGRSVVATRQPQTLKIMMMMMMIIRMTLMMTMMTTLMMIMISFKPKISVIFLCFYVYDEAEDDLV